MGCGPSNPSDSTAPCVVTDQPLVPSTDSASPSSIALAPIAIGALSEVASVMGPPSDLSSDSVAGVTDEIGCVADYASGAIEKTEKVLAALPPSLLDETLAAAKDGAEATVALVQSRAPILAGLCSCVAQVFSAIAPAVPFAGAAAAFVGLAAEQGAKYIAAAQAAEDLRAWIASSHPTIVKFAKSRILAHDHAALLNCTCLTLRAAAETLVKSYHSTAAPSTLSWRARLLRAEVFKYFVAGTSLDTLVGLKADLIELVAGMAAAASVDSNAVVHETNSVARATLEVVNRLEAAAAVAAVAAVAASSGGGAADVASPVPFVPAGVPNQSSHDPNYLRLAVDNWLWAQVRLEAPCVQ
jgi:hypothetical protein